MRHRLQSSKLGRSPEHRAATMAALVCALIERKRIETTHAKAKQARSMAEKLVTIGREELLAVSQNNKDKAIFARRKAITALRHPKFAAMLVKDVVPQFSGRNGGYTRIIKLGKRKSDSSEMVLLEWVGIAPPERKKKKKVEEKPVPPKS